MNARAWLVLMVVLLAAGAGWCGAPAPEPGSGRRVALVIGNGGYDERTGWNRLRNPPGDAAAVARTLSEVLHFDQVILTTDRRRAQLIEDLDAFAQALGEGDTAFFFYSGHGAGVGEENYLIPVDAAEPASERRLRADGVALDEVLGVLRERRTALNVIVLDACRNNPLARGAKSYGGSGLKGIERERFSGETLIAYATGPGETAADGGGALSPYTAALVAELAVPGPRGLWDIFAAVTGRVQRATGARQQPWKNDTLTATRYLVPLAAGQSAAVPPPPPAPVAHLQVNVDAPGARVFVDGRERGGAAPGEPLNLSNLALGTVLVEADAPGRHRVQQRVALQAGAWTQVVLRLPVAEPVAGETWTEPKTGMVFVRVPGGTFTMGCGGAWAGKCFGDEKPPRQVTVQGFWMARTEVTQAQWTKVMGSNPSYFKGCDDCPVEMVSWDDAQGFIARLDPGGSQGLRLPSEAQWEYACRGGGKDETYCGGQDPERLAWYDKNSGRKTHPVGGKAANGLGLYDMSGNVWEWVQDAWHPDYQRAPTDGRPWEDATGEWRVLRGGSWIHDAVSLRCAFRNVIAPGIRNLVTGFRLALGPELQQASQAGRERGRTARAGSER